MINRVISSKPFKFTVGPGKREFTVHSAPVSAQSPALDRLVNDSFKEAKEFHVKLDSVTEETFILFTQYAYTGDYKLDDCVFEVLDPLTEANDLDPNRPARHDDSESSSAPPALRPQSSWGFSTSSKKSMRFKTVGEELNELQNIKAKMSNSKLWNTSTQACSAVPQAPDERLGTRPPISNYHLPHARVYVFANYYGIAKLADLSFHKLGKLLLDLEMNYGGVEDVFQLLEYCYNEPTLEKLRSHLILFAACKASELWEVDEFRGLVTRNGELAAAFLRFVIERLV